MDFNNLIFSTLIIAFVILVVVVISSLSITFALQIKPLQNDESAFPPLNNIEINSDSIEDLISYGNTSVREDKYEEAIQYYDQALAIDTKFVQALRGKVVTLSALGRYGEAIQYSDKALAIDPNYVGALNNKGHDF